MRARNLKMKQPNKGKIELYANDSYCPNQLIIEKREKREEEML